MKGEKKKRREKRDDEKRRDGEIEGEEKKSTERI